MLRSKPSGGERSGAKIYTGNQPIRGQGTTTVPLENMNLPEGTLGQGESEDEWFVKRSCSTTTESDHGQPSYDTSWPPRDSMTCWDHDITPAESSTVLVEPPPPPNRSIYPLETRPGYAVNVIHHNPDWALQFEKIRAHLHKVFTTADPPAPYTTIEHIGSTSIPNLAAKPNIDILVTIPNRSALALAIEALNWEFPEAPPYIKYTQVPSGGGIQGRESFKLYVPHWSPYYYSTPERSVYLIDESEGNEAGRIQIRGYRSVRDTLRDPKNEDLLNEYGEVKLELAKRVYKDTITYSRLKDDVIRKVLRRAGWTDGEIAEKERLSQRVWIEDDPAY